ncbi:FimB/Mfa2 family fimbrial subunit [Mucilaginibacter lacusdianchii]|uniref:FimB/Mfa2 family fimbrial subunit n=1 Tax=Mucilaginibacter lacusdianchii TaxID=2684211 RepID=UPI00131ABF1C|nr:FimB/Mfa2 family fimbrial subunit [Mucilaginibacter sp. JXJ CY 39]
MKLKFIYIVLLSICFASCKKDSKNTNTDKPAEKLYPVTFGVSSFTQNSIPLSVGKQTNTIVTTATSTLKDTLDVLYYYLVDADGKVRSHIQQTSSASNFGTIKDSVAAGTYTVVFTGGKSGLQGINNTPVIPASAPLANNITFTYNTSSPGQYIAPWQDFFYKKFTVQIPTNNSNKQINLDRVVAQLQVVIKDALPANVASVAVFISNDLYDQNLLNLKTTGSENSRTFKMLTETEKGKSNYTLTTYTMAYGAPFKVTINCYDNNGGLLISKQVDDVTAQANKRTILSGNLFTPSTSSNAFNVSVNVQWNATNVIGF